MVKKELTEDEWFLIEKRLESMPDSITFGTTCRSLSKKELLNELKIRSDLGESYANTQLSFLGWLIGKAKIKKLNITHKKTNE